MTMFQSVTKYLEGRSTMFCVAFFVVGNVLAWVHKLDMAYVAFMGTLLGAVLGHSVKEDYFQAKNGNGNHDHDDVKG